MTRRLALLGLIGLVAISGQATARPAACAGPTAEAIAVRILLSELTVGALACDADEAYAGFVTRQQAALQSHGATLRRHFDDRYGAEVGPRRLDALVTAFANEASSRKTAWAADYCRFVDALAKRATAQPADRLGVFAAAQPHARRYFDRRGCP